MKKLLQDKRYAGIFWAVIISATFAAISFSAIRFLSGTPWFLFSSILRVVFGFIVLFAVKKIYGKTAKEVLSLKGSKKALVAGAGFIIYFVYYVTVWCLGIRTIKGLSVGLLITQIFLQQITTGFYEELHYRVLILEGYFHGPQNTRNKLLYGFINFLVFGFIHVMTGWDTYRFILTGAIGFALGVIYLKSGNVFVPMVLHFVYDIFANLTDYIEWNGTKLFAIMNSYEVFYSVLIVMVAVSLVILLRKEEKDQPPAAC